MIEVRPVAGPEELEAALAVRREVFIDEQGVAEHEELDGRDPDALHLVVVEDGRVVGTCRLLPAGGAMKLGRMAIVPAARRRGLATRLVAEAEAHARAGGHETMVLDAQLEARPLYAAAGYREHGDIFTDAGIEHVRMVKDLA